MKKTVQRDIRRGYWKHVEDVVTPGNDATPHEKSRCSKRFWGLVKSSGSDSVGIPGLTDKHGVVHNDAKSKAEILNKQFTSVFSPQVPMDPHSQARNTTAHPRMPDIHITTAGISKLLCELHPNKACGPDQIKPIVMRTLHLQLTPILQIIYEFSYMTGMVPKEWRSAYVTPIYKKGKRSDAANYRPISLTCVASKMMEHVLENVHQ